MTTNADWRDVSGALDGVVLAHGWRAGEVPLLMIHGIGPGTRGAVNFEPLVDRLPARFSLHLIDLAGFGASGRKRAAPFFDVDFWLRQIDQAIDVTLQLHGRAPLIVGNSVGGALALKAAAARPEIQGVLAIGAPAGPPATPALRAFWTAPQDAASLTAALTPMTGAQTPPTAALVDARLQPFQSSDYGAYFNAMLADPDACLRAIKLTAAEAGLLSAKVSIVHGRLDRACGDDTLMAELAPLIPSASITLLGGCGHNVIAERPADVLAALLRLAEEIMPE